MGKRDAEGLLGCETRKSVKPKEEECYNDVHDTTMRWVHDNNADGLGVLIGLGRQKFMATRTRILSLGAFIGW